MDGDPGTRPVDGRQAKQKLGLIAHGRREGLPGEQNIHILVREGGRENSAPAIAVMGGKGGNPGLVNCPDLIMFRSGIGDHHGRTGKIMIAGGDEEIMIGRPRDQRRAHRARIPWQVGAEGIDIHHHRRPGAVPQPAKQLTERGAEIRWPKTGRKDPKARCRLKGCRLVRIRHGQKHDIERRPGDRPVQGLGPGGGLRAGQGTEHPASILAPLQTPKREPLIEARRRGAAPGLPEQGQAGQHRAAHDRRASQGLGLGGAGQGQGDGIIARLQGLVRRSVLPANGAHIPWNMRPGIDPVLIPGAHPTPLRRPGSGPRRPAGPRPEAR